MVLLVSVRVRNDPLKNDIGAYINWLDSEPDTFEVPGSSPGAPTYKTCTLGWLRGLSTGLQNQQEGFDSTVQLEKIYICGISSMVLECLPSKQEMKVRFLYPAL